MPPYLRYGMYALYSVALSLRASDRMPCRAPPGVLLIGYPLAPVPAPVAPGRRATRPAAPRSPGPRAPWCAAGPASGWPHRTTAPASGFAPDRSSLKLRPGRGRRRGTAAAPRPRPRPSAARSRSDRTRRARAARDPGKVGGDVLAPREPAVAQPRVGEAGRAARRVERGLRGVHVMALRVQPGQRLVARRQAHLQALAAAADGRRQARG